jgi:acyl-CoA thioesterase-1
MVVISATALPWWFYIAWTIALLGWFFIGWFQPRMREVVRAAVLACTVIAVAMELPHQLLHPLPPNHFTRLYVIGDSISAGLGRPSEKTWPAMMREERGIQIVDLSRAGCTANQALKIVQSHPSTDGVVLIEIGGNDLIGKTNPRQFGADLDAMVKALQNTNRPVVMFELPLFPFDNAYGMEQRNVAARYGIHLIPRRFMAGILASPDGTVDGIHLTNKGQRRLADLVWEVVGEALGGSTNGK